MIELATPRKAQAVAEPNLPEIPYRFDKAYARCFAVPEVAADVRHVYLIAEILKSWPFESALEIGSFNGATATAFVEAINSGKGLGERGTATFCDVSVTHSLIDVVSNCREPERVKITPQPSWAVLDSKVPFDFIYVDGAHDLDSVTLELKRLMLRRPLCVMAHDTNATKAGYAKCEGAAHLRDVFNYNEGAECWTLEDCKKRPGERTERGMFFATTSRRLLILAAEAFKKWCP